MNNHATASKQPATPTARSPAVSAAAPMLQRKEETSDAEKLSRLMGRVQTGLAVSHPEDPNEKDADRVADQIMSMPEPVRPQAAANSPAEEKKLPLPQKEKEPKKIQKKELSSTTPAVSSPSAVHLPQVAGQPLSESVRSFMEPRFGVDFSAVRVHTDREANESAKAINAIAFTFDNNIFFGKGRYAPENNEGKRLLGHELAHIVQHPAGIMRDGEDAGAGKDNDADLQPAGRKTPEPGELNLQTGYHDPKLGGLLSESAVLSNESEFSTDELQWSWPVDTTVLQPVEGANAKDLKAKVVGVKQSNIQVNLHVQPGDGATAPVDKSSPSMPFTVRKPKVSSWDVEVQAGPGVSQDRGVEGNKIRAVNDDTAVVKAMVEEVENYAGSGIQATADAGGAGTGTVAGDNPVLFSFLFDKEGMFGINAGFTVPGMEAPIDQTYSVEVEDSPEAFLARSSDIRDFTGAGGNGGFEAQLVQGVLYVVTRTGIMAKNGLTLSGETVTAGDPGLAGNAAYLTSLLNIENYKKEDRPFNIKADVEKYVDGFVWKDSDAKLQQLKTELENSYAMWSGKHHFTPSAKTSADWQSVSVSVDVHGEVSIIMDAGQGMAGDPAVAAPGAGNLHLRVALIKYPDAVAEPPARPKNFTGKKIDGSIDRHAKMKRPESAGHPGGPDPTNDKDISKASSEDQYLYLRTSGDLDKITKYKHDEKFPPIRFMVDSPDYGPKVAPKLNELFGPAPGSSRQEEVQVILQAKARDTALADLRMQSMQSDVANFNNPAKTVIVLPHIIDPAVPATADGGPGSVEVKVKGTEEQNQLTHELGHAAFGLGDQYPGGGRKVGDPATHSADAANSGVPGGAPVEYNKGVMSGGNEVLPEDYASFQKALDELTSGWGTYGWQVK